MQGIAGEQIVDLLLGERNGLFQIHQSSLAASGRPATHINRARRFGVPLPLSTPRFAKPG
jgi:hypothetical protein